MNRDIISYTSQGRNHPNQDMYGYADNVFFVFDGATSLFSDSLLGGNDVQRCMQRLKEALLRRTDQGLSLEELLKEALQETEDSFRNEVKDFDRIEKYKLPTFACCMISLQKDFCEYLILADCELRVGNTVISDPGFALSSKRNRENERQVLRQYGVSTRKDLPENVRKEALERIYEQDRLVRMALNTEEGYWVGSLNGKGILHAVIGRIAVKDEEPVFLYCDGVTALTHVDAELFTANTIDKIQKIRDYTDDDVTILYLKEKK